MSVSADEFDAFFEELWSRQPFPWQRRLARRICEGSWPDSIDLPTASGKTACLDAAVFALAVQAARAPEQRTVGRRIFFVVNRRVIVDEAHVRAMRIARRLDEARREGATDSVLKRVADCLVALSGESDPEAVPLDVALQRGGIYRDNRWARSITQPTIITTTVDQVGSRLLFRGYGVSPAARPLHAALVANDSVILLDEAHISQPFLQTLEAVRQYRGERWAREPVAAAFAVVPMTATPGRETPDVLCLEQEDREHPVLAPRHTAAKPVALFVAERAKGAKGTAELASVLAERARDLVSPERRTVAVIVNRVATARAVFALLASETGRNGETAEVHLAIGRMRPLDRDALNETLRSRLGPDAQRGPQDRPLYVVATQCLEVGADFDFDAMVSECAALDALRQRFGRLNRFGRSIPARGCIVVRADQMNDEDAVYGTALAATWQWLARAGPDGTVDFSTDGLQRLLQGVELDPMLTPRRDAPVLFPAYLDAWVQTNPAPTPDPDPALFLHGPERGQPDVSVCWRWDLTGTPDRERWTRIVGLCPPSSPECMPVPIGALRTWLAASSLPDEEGTDLLDCPAEAPDATQTVTVPALAWRGPVDSRLVSQPDDVRPGDVVVLPVTAGGWSALGHVPGAPAELEGAGPSASGPEWLALDVAEHAYRESRGRVLLRLTEARVKAWTLSDEGGRLAAWVVNPQDGLAMGQLRHLLSNVADGLGPDFEEEASALRLLVDPALGLDYERYPEEGPVGVALWSRRRAPSDRPGIRPAMDDGLDDTSRVTRTTPVPLDRHLKHVRQEIDWSLPLLPVTCGFELARAAEVHDWGKADDRFQALLLCGTRSDAWAQPSLWAKSAQFPATPAARRRALVTSQLPEGFRHEMLSVQLTEASGRLPEDREARELILHLVASHHGYARPFAPVVRDGEHPPVSLGSLGLAVGFSGAERDATPPHRLDSGIPQRFWHLTRRFGWWGLAYLEATLRMADQRASMREDQMQTPVDEEAA